MYRHTILLEGISERPFRLPNAPDGIKTILSISFSHEYGYREFTIISVEEENLNPSPKMGFDEWW